MHQAFGAFFKKAAPFFKMYSAYVSNYDRAMETLVHLIEVRCFPSPTPLGLLAMCAFIQPTNRPTTYNIPTNQKTISTTARRGWTSPPSCAPASCRKGARA